MQIDGRAATTYTLVVGPGQKAAIDLPFGLYNLIFNSSVTSPSATLSSGSNEIMIDGPDTSLGLAVNFDIPLTTGTTAKLALVVYAIGDSATATRVIHYTLS